LLVQNAKGKMLVAERASDFRKTYRLNYPTKNCSDCSASGKRMTRNDNDTTVVDLKNSVSKFVKDREWGRFHTPRNLAESICIESAELLEIFQWSTEEDSLSTSDQSTVRKVEDELADVLIYCVGLANVVGIDITTAILNKMERNEEKYPADRYKGTYSKPGNR